MVESMIGPDTMKKLMAKMLGLVFTILAFVGMLMIVFTSIAPTFHAHLWPALLSVGFAGAWLTAKGKGTKMRLAGIAFLAGLWILLNSIMGWVEPAAGSAGAEFMTPVMLALSAMGALLVVFGSLIGILGAMKS
ncbi:unnamed protein product [marine sediment metagenome]|uniref:Uncharacterized protein n=1 Tax=marine sediment metagenome TaxID=412755 RepID=X0X8P1_9ZZZZ